MFHLEKWPDRMTPLPALISVRTDLLPLCCKFILLLFYTKRDSEGNRSGVIFFFSQCRIRREMYTWNLEHRVNEMLKIVFFAKWKSTSSGDSTLIFLSFVDRCMVYLIYLYLVFSDDKCCQMFQILQRHQSTCTEKGTNFSKWHAAFIFGLNTRKHMQTRSIHSSSASVQAIIVSPLQGHLLLGKWRIWEMSCSDCVNATEHQNQGYKTVPRLFSHCPLALLCEHSKTLSCVGSPLSDSWPGQGHTTTHNIFCTAKELWWF